MWATRFSSHCWPGGARARIAGISFQWDGRNAVQRAHQSWPGLRLMQSENECGDGRNTWAYAHYVFALLRHYLTNGANAYVYWNMLLPGRPIPLPAEMSMTGKTPAA